MGEGVRGERTDGGRKRERERESTKIIDGVEAFDLTFSL